MTRVPRQLQRRPLRDRPSAASTTPFSHIDGGKARMVDVGEKPATRRVAVAEAYVEVGPAVARVIRRHGGGAKGNVLETARLAGILAAKRTAELIPLCHPLAIDAIDVDASLRKGQVRLVATVKCQSRTGVEMEALTAVSVAALCVYDMIKSMEKGVTIGPIRLLEKSGGKSGHWRRKE